MAAQPRHFVVFGVSGAGKTTIGRMLADAFGRVFVDADDFHSPESIRKMSAGIPLTSADREPWLKSICDWMNGQAAAGRSTVVACSALKHVYRDQLRHAEGGVLFVFLNGPREVIEERLAARVAHFMPPSLLASQLEALEPLGADECGIAVDVRSPADAVIERMRAAFASSPEAMPNQFTATTEETRT